MPRARETSILNDLSEVWKELTEEHTKKKKEPPRDVIEKGAQILVMLWGMYYVRRNLKKKGAPDWIAYAFSILDYSVTRVGVQLYWIEKHLAKQKLQTRPRLQLSDLSLRPGESPTDVLDRVRKLLN